MVLLILLAIGLLPSPARPISTDSKTIEVSSSTNINLLTPLNLGILNLDNNKIEDAQKEFAKIPLTSADWTLNVQALMRFSFFKKDFIEVWRLGQILRRIKKDNSETRALEKTALYLQNICEHKSETEELTLRELLLEAATYRFHEKFQKLNSTPWGEFFRQWEAGQIMTTSSSSTVLYLSEIPSAELRSGGGCHFSNSKLNKKDRAKKIELKHLLKFFERFESLNNQIDLKKSLSMSELQDNDDLMKNYLNFSTESNLFFNPKAIGLLFARALYLELDLQQKSSEILSKLAKSLPLHVLKLLPDSNRRFLWDKIKIEKGLSEKEQQNFILSLVLDPKEANEIDWLDLIDWNSVSMDQQILIYHNFLKFESLSENPYLLISLANLYWKLQNMKEVLPLLRRLLVLNSQTLSNTEREAALSIASDMFSEVLWNETESGAFQASIPNQLWKEFYQKALRELALKGNSKSFDKLMTNKNVKKTLRPQYQELLGLIVHRKTQKFQEYFGQLKIHHGINKNVQMIIDDLAASQFIESKEVRRELHSFRNIVISYLKKQLEESPGQNSELWQQLIHTLSDNETDTDQWMAGNQMVRKGILKLGSVSLKESLVLDRPFKFEVPKQLPILDLILLPRGHGGEQWILE